jgi:protein ImuB
VQEVLVGYRAPPPLQAQWTFEHPCSRQEVVDRAVEHLIEHLVELLIQRNHGAVEIVCQLDCVDAPSSRIEIGLFRPTVTVPHLVELIHMQLEQLHLSGPVRHMSIRATTTAPLEDRQHRLLYDPTHDVPRELASLVDRLSSRLGRDRIVGAELQADVQVECAYRYVALTGTPSRVRSRASSKKRRRGPGPGQRPLWLHMPPLPLDVIAVAPSGPPVSFVYRNQRFHIARHWGPERIETGWWRGRSVRRDYYRVEDQRGSRFWLFRRLQDGKWFLHGEFE